MANIGIFFGTDTGKARKITKVIHKQLGEATAAPVNVNRATLADLLAYPALLLGTSTPGDGQLPGLEAGGKSESWAKFIHNLGDVNLQGKTMALFDLGDQCGYPDNPAGGLRPLYGVPRTHGVIMIGSWPSEGYEFSAPSAPGGDHFVELVLNQDNQFDGTDARLVTRLEEVKPYLL